MRTFIIICAWLALGTAAFPQTDTAALSGRITDPSGAVIIGADVSATNTGTGTTLRTVTNDAGVYNFSALPPGSYTLTVLARGFQQVKQQGLELHVQDRVGRNVQLPVGSSDQTVTVQAGAAQVNTESAAVGTVVSREFIANLPLNGRSFQSLITLTPGVVVTPVSSGSPGQFSMNGQRPDSNYFTVDGVSANVSIGAGAGALAGANGSGVQPSAAGGFNNLVSLDALQEFKVQTSTFSPEFGRTPGGQVSIVTRSGTNAFHGDAFEYLRNNVFDANDWFLNGLSAKPGIPSHPPERQNDFGGVLGGRILKNKLFFFGSYEGVRLTQPTPYLKLVPSLCARGDGPCPAGTTPAVAAVQPLLHAYPVPTAGGCGSALAPSADPLLSPFCQGFPAIVTMNSYSIRSDYYLNSKANVFFRYVNSPSTSTTRGTGNASSLWVAQPGWTSWTAGGVYIFSPRLVNDARFNFSRATGYAYSQLDSFGGAVPLTTTDPIVFPNLNLPGIGQLTPANTRFFITYSPGSSWRDGLETNNAVDQYNFVDSLSLTSGNHQVKFGVDFRRLTPAQARAPYQQSYTFLTSAAMNSGIASSYTAIQNPYTVTLYHNLSLYAQDAWKVTPKLTITYGVRWEYNPAPGTTDKVPDLAFTQLNYSNLAATDIAPVGAPIYRNQRDAFAPRVGLAYRLSDKVGWTRVIRGGAGIFFDTTGDFDQNSTLNGATTSLKNLTVPATISQQNPTLTNPNPNQAPWPYVLSSDPNIRLPRTYQMNVAFQQELGNAQSVTLTYAGAFGRGLFLQRAFAPPNADLPQGFEAITNDGSSDYHSFQALFQRRLVKGFQAMASYSWSHSIDTGSNSAYTLPNNTVESVSNERGSSDFDIRHSFQTAITYSLPSAYHNHLLKAVLGHWGTDAVFHARSAPPINISDSAVVFSQFTPGLSLGERPNLIPGQPFFLYGGDCASAYHIPSCPGGEGLNKAAFAAPLPGIQGNMPRNALRGFAWRQLDFTLRREFPIHEAIALQFRADVFNITNTPFFGLSGNSLNVGSPAFGTSTAMLDNSLFSSGTVSGFNPLYQVGGPRSMQLSLKLVF
jgi:hypothetical protein